MNTAIRMIPSSLEICFPKSIKTSGRETIASMYLVSSLIGRFTLIPLATKTMTPATSARFAMLLPMTVPNRSEDSPASALLIPTKSSGKEVEKAMMMNATINSLKRKNADIFSNAFTVTVALTIRASTNKMNKSRFCKSIVHSFLV